MVEIFKMYFFHISHSFERYFVQLNLQRTRCERNDEKIYTNLEVTSEEVSSVEKYKDDIVIKSTTLYDFYRAKPVNVESSEPTSHRPRLNNFDDIMD